MADNVAITAGSGTDIATDQVTGTSEHVQLMKLAISTDGSRTLVPADSTNGIDVDVTRVSGDVTVVQATASNLNANVSGTVSANQNGSWNVGLNAGSNAIGSITNTSFAATQSTASSLLNKPYGAVTTAAPSYTNGTDNALSLTTGGALRVDGSAATQPVSGTVTANAGTGSFTVAQATASNLNANVSGTVSANQSGAWNVGINAGSNAIGSITNTSFAVTQATAANLNATVVGSGSFTIVGDVADDSIDSGNPIKIGAFAEANPSTSVLVADGDRTNVHADIDGLLMVKPYTAFGDILVERVSDTGGTSTASTVFGATAGARNMITTIAVYNDSTTNGFIDFRDGTAGTVLFTLPLPAKGGAVTNFPIPLRQTTANTAFAYDVSAALTTVYISLIGFKSKV